MNPTVKKLLLYAPAAALGLWAMELQTRILATGFDHKGLLIGDDPNLALVWGITGAYGLAVLVLTLTLGGCGTYGQNFPRCVLSGGVMIAAGLTMGFCGLNGMVPGGVADGVLRMAVGMLMAVGGIFRMLGKKSPFLEDLLIGVYYAYSLLTSYTGWNADPHVQRYAFQLLAGVAVMLFSIHRARFAGGYPERRRLVAAGFLGIFLSFAAMPGARSMLHWAASGLWCAGGMCDLRRLEQKTPGSGEEGPTQETE